MVNLFINKKLTKRVAIIYKDLRSVTSKLHHTAGSISFIKKALYHEIIPKFARVNSNSINKNDQYKSKRSTLSSHLNEHVHALKSLVSKHYVLKEELKQVTGRLLYKSMINYIHMTQYHERMNSIKSKSYKLKPFISEKTPSKFKVPIVNLLSCDLSELEQKQLHLGLEYSFDHKPKHLKKNIVANFKIVSHKVSESITNDKLEDFHEFLTAYIDIFKKNIYVTKYFTYSNSKNIIKDENTAILSGDKDSSIVIMQKDDYNHKLKQVIDEEIKNGVYTPIEDLRKFQDFL